MPRFQSRAIDWLFQQGVSTVPLLLLLYGLGYAVERVVPRLLAEVQAGYERIAIIQDRQLQLLVDEFRADQERDQQLIEKLLSEQQRQPARVAHGSPTTP